MYLLQKLYVFYVVLNTTRLLEIMKNDPSQSSNNVEIKRYMKLTDNVYDVLTLSWHSIWGVFIYL